MLGYLRKNQNFPFAAKKFPVFYGWVIIGVGAIGILMSIPGQTVGVSVFTEHLINSLGLSKNQLSFSYMIGTIGSSLLLTKAGKQYDKYGARTMAIVASLILGMVLVYNTRIGHIATFLNTVFPTIEHYIFTFALMAFGFFGIRFFGQGILTMVSRNMVMKWFDKRRGLANIVLGIIVSFGFSYSPKLVDSLIKIYNWRGAWLIMAVFIGVIFTIFAIVFFRDNPEDSGCIPDGKEINDNTGKKPIKAKNYTLQEARRSYEFWIYSLIMAVDGLFITALTFWITSIFEINGFDHNEAISIFLPSSVVAVTLHLVGSYFSDFIKLKYFLLINTWGIIISCLGVIFLGDVSYAKMLIIVGNGLISGTFSILSAITWPRFFGTKHLGAISGFAMGLVVFGSAVGPFIFSQTLTYTGSYSASTWVFLVFGLVLFVLGFKANNKNEDRILSH